MTDISIVITASQPLALTIDYLSNKLYWSDQTENLFMIKETSLNTLQTGLVLSSGEFSPFRLAVVQNYILATSDKHTSFAVINHDKSTVRFINSPNNESYYGLTVVSQLRKPSRCKHIIIL